MEVPMRQSCFFAAAVLLMASTSAYADNAPKSDAREPVLQNDAKPIAAQPVIRDDDTSNVLLLDQDSLQALPNPYANPAPRMISDVWAMRT
jgi:hypothetical protein